MALTELGAPEAGLSRADRRHLAGLVAEWAMLADFCFSDLLLYVPLVSDDEFAVVAHMRPSTSQTIYHAALVGERRTTAQRPVITEALTTGQIVTRDVDSTWLGDRIQVMAIPVRRGGRVIAVLARESPRSIRRIPGEVETLNDADAAGLAEVRYGAAAGRGGVIILTTLGTGIGSALIKDGLLVPNTELGHLEIDGHDAETKASDAARDREDLNWEQWAERLQRYFGVVEDLFSPDLIVVGGGVSKKHDHFLPHLHLRAPIVPAQLRNAAGIVGAASLAAEDARRTAQAV